jgi:hypothetical protein
LENSLLRSLFRLRRHSYVVYFFRSYSRRDKLALVGLHHLEQLLLITPAG